MSDNDERTNIIKMMMVSTPNNLRDVLRARYTYEARESVEKGMRTYNSNI